MIFKKKFEEFEEKLGEFESEWLGNLGGILKEK